jgi:hypothetical protein
VATLQKRAFLLDLAHRQARVLISGHESGTLAGEPLVLTSGVLLPLTQGEQMQLVGVRWTPSASPPPAAALLRWPGRQLLQIVSDGESALLLTDRREVILVQAAAEGPLSARILGGSKWTLRLPTLAAQNRLPRVHILGERLGDWWLATDGAVLRLHWDDYRAQLHQESYPLPNGEVVDFSWDNQHPGRVVLLVREPAGSLLALAWDLTQAQVVWNRPVATRQVPGPTKR